MKTRKLTYINILLTMIISIYISSCSNDTPKPQIKTYVLDYSTSKAVYGNSISITKKNIGEEDDELYTLQDGVITFNQATPIESTKSIEVYLEGYFKGQIVNNVKDLVLNLKGVYLENEDAAVIIGNKKTEISAKKDTINYIVTTGDSAEKIGAITTDGKNLELGGGGTCYIISEVCHGLKADQIEFKGSGKYFVQGAATGSAINCNDFIIKSADPMEPGKSISIYMFNASNGIKADKTISISNGNIYFYGIKTALKTDVAEEGGDPISSITLSKCTITTEGVTNLYKTDTFNKDDETVVITEN